MRHGRAGHAVVGPPHTYGFVWFQQRHPDGGGEPTFVAHTIDASISQMHALRVDDRARGGVTRLAGRAEHARELRVGRRRLARRARVPCRRAKQDDSHAKQDDSHAKQDDSHAKQDDSHAKQDASHAKQHAYHAKQDDSQAKQDDSRLKRALRRAKQDGSHAKQEDSHAARAAFAVTGSRDRPRRALGRCAARVDRVTICLERKRLPA